MSIDAPKSQERIPRTPPLTESEPAGTSREMTWAGWFLRLVQRMCLWFLRFVRRMCLLFAVYALSIGPLYWQWYGARFAGGSPWLAGFYEPLVILAAWIAPFGEWMNWYVNLWIA